MKILAVQRCFCLFWHFLLRIRGFDCITTSGLKSDVIFEFATPIFL